MSFEPYIENRKESYRPCSCGRDHEMKIIHGIFHYAEDSYTVFCVGLIEHKDDRHVWLSFITGEWPGTNEADCFVTSHVWLTPDKQIMKIKDSSLSPFKSSETFDCYPVSREQVLAQSGAKDWFIKTYLSLFESDKEIGEYINA